MLHFNPAKRTSVRSALSHPFFSSIRKENEEITGNPIGMDVETGIQTMTYLKARIFAECKLYEVKRQKGEEVVDGESAGSNENGNGNDSTKSSANINGKTRAVTR